MNRLPHLGQMVGLGRREAAGAGWLVAANLLRLSVAAAIDIAVARYLLPDDFGRLRFAMSMTIIFAAVSSMGLASLGFRDLVREPEKRDEIMGTMLGMRLVVAIAMVPVAVLSTWLVSPGDPTLLVMTAILSSLATFAVFESIDIFLNAEMRMRQVATARVINLIITSAAKLLMIALDAPMWAFAAAYGVDFLMIGMTFNWAYARAGRSALAWRFSHRRAVYMMRLLWPVMIGGVAATLNTRVDQVMLGGLGDVRQVGIYAAAARLSEAWIFLAEAVAVAAFPALVTLSLSDRAAYRQRLQKLYSLLAWGGITLAIVVTVVSGPLIDLLYGPEFGPAAGMLTVQIWGAPFLFMGALFSRWLTNESFFGAFATRHVLGAGLNIGLNLLLIPEHGGVGASVATLISYAVAHYFVSFLQAPTRDTARMMTFGLLALPLWTIGSVWKFLRRPLSVRGEPD